MKREINTQQIAAMMGMKASQFCLLFGGNRGNDFPPCIRTGGVTGRTKYYDYDAVVAWVEEWQGRKIAKTDTKVLAMQFLAGKFDRRELQKKYLSKAIYSRQKNPQTQKTHVKENFDGIDWHNDPWRGLI